jgi:hypothetical protein
MTRPITPEEAESVILARMAASRMALLEANRTPIAVPAPVALAQTRRTAADFVGALAKAPRVTVLLALCAGAIVLGPRRTVTIAGRSGAAAWVGASVRKLVQKTA